MQVHMASQCTGRAGRLPSRQLCQVPSGVPTAGRHRHQPRPVYRRLHCTATASAAAGQSAQQPAGHQPAVLAAAASLWQHLLGMPSAAVAALQQPLTKDQQQAVNGSIKGGLRNARMLAAVAPFAATTATTSGKVTSILLLTKAASSFIKVYLLLLFLRVLLSWFPVFKWDGQPWLALRQVTDPYLKLFRGFVPPLMGTVDFTPLFGFLILQWLAGVLEVQDDDDIW